MECTSKMSVKLLFHLLTISFHSSYLKGTVSDVFPTYRGRDMTDRPLNSGVVDSADDKPKNIFFPSSHREFPT